MSMYGDYIKERLGDEIYETEQGFATYRFLDEKTVYIVDVYIKPDFRRSRAASNIGDTIVELSKKQGATKLIGTVTPSAKGSTESMRFLLNYGMRIQSAKENLIVLEKEI